MLKIERYLDEKQRILLLPMKKPARMAVLRYLAEKFECNRNYTEKEVNRIIDEWHTFGDYFLLRRELIEAGLMCREPNGSRYWKETIEQNNEP